MLSRLGKKLKALVSRETVKTVPTAPSVATDGQDRLAASDTKYTSTSSTVEPAQSLAATEPLQTTQPAPVLELEKSSRAFDRIEGNELEVALNATEADQTHIAWAKVADKAPDERLEAGTNSDDDLTVLKLGLAIDEPRQDNPFKMQATHLSSGPSHKPELSASHNAPEEEHLLDLATRRFASTRLINVLRNAEGELPTTTVAAYMRAPDAAREAFKVLENSGQKTAMELDDLVRKFAREVDQNRQAAADSIVDVVRVADCSVRLLNAITANAHRLPVDTVREYMRAPQHSRQAFLKRNSQAPCPIGLRGFVPSEPCDDLRW